MHKTLPLLLVIGCGSSLRPDALLLLDIDGGFDASNDSDSGDVDSGFDSGVSPAFDAGEGDDSGSGMASAIDAGDFDSALDAGDVDAGTITDIDAGNWWDNYQCCPSNFFFVSCSCTEATCCWQAGGEANGEWQPACYYAIGSYEVTSCTYYGPPDGGV
jgi:hypothetical protein